MMILPVHALLLHFVLAFATLQSARGRIAFTWSSVPAPRLRCARPRGHTVPRAVATNREDINPASLPEVIAIIAGVPASSEEGENLLVALRAVGFGRAQWEGVDSVVGDAESSVYYRYQFSKATGMLKFVGEPTPSNRDIPKWVPIVRGEENVLVANGWSFLDPDESEPLSAFDVDAANQEGTYVPKWGLSSTGEKDSNNVEDMKLSSLGFDIHSLSHEDIQRQAEDHLTNDLSRRVLLEGGTDPRGQKRTNNEYDFSGSHSVRAGDIEEGIFVCAIGGLPLFSTHGLSPTTASSGWLSFGAALVNDHIRLVPPTDGVTDSRTEVICAKSGCHLGHYFGRREGYCINASALNFIPSSSSELSFVLRPRSWIPLDDIGGGDPGMRTLRAVLDVRAKTETVALGAGCFWHVEYALRRLEGVMFTETGYAGGTSSNPTYGDVCRKDTGHAEVVKVCYDTDTLPSSVLFDCFLAMHDPTKVRAHGKHAAGTGQYRSCIIVSESHSESTALRSLRDCETELGKTLSTEVKLVGDADSDSWFWRGEDRHQRHDERGSNRGDNDRLTLSKKEWLKTYGRRTASVYGSANTVPTIAAQEPGDDGMAMMMI